MEPFANNLSDPRERSTPDPSMKTRIFDAVVSPDLVSVAIHRFGWGNDFEAFDVKTGKRTGVVDCPQNITMWLSRWENNTTLRYRTLEREEKRKIYRTVAFHVGSYKSNVVDTMKMASDAGYSPHVFIQSPRASNVAEWFSNLKVYGPPASGDTIRMDLSLYLSGHTGSVSRDGNTGALWTVLDSPNTSVIIVRDGKETGRFPLSENEYVRQVEFRGDIILVGTVGKRSRIAILENPTGRLIAELPGGYFARNR